MRLFHKDLLSVLPRLQLLGQWRECCLIAKALRDNNLNHVLVNRVKEYDISHLWAYSVMVCDEMKRRGYNVNFSRFANHIQHVIIKPVKASELFDGWHEDRYLRQCLYNLEEKAMAGGIPAYEWQKIYNAYGKQFDLWCGNE